MGDDKTERMRQARRRRLAQQAATPSVPRPRPAPRPAPEPAPRPTPRPAPKRAPSTSRGNASPVRRTPSAETDAFSRLGHVAALSSLLWTVLLVTGWQLPLRLAGDLPFEWEWTVKLAIRERTAPWFFPFFHDVLGSGPAEGRLWLYPALAVAAALVVRWSAAPPPAVRALLEWPAALYGFAALTALGPWALTVWPVTVVMVLLSLVVLPRRHR